MKNLKLLALTIPLVSLFTASLNLSAASATTVVSQHTNKTETQLLAQGSLCSVVNIRSGQLALRVSPNGRSKAGLDNGNTVALLRNGPGVWSYVRVLEGPNRRVNTMEGWVNSDYLSCSQPDEAPPPPVSESCNVVGIRTGQLALRFSPDGRSRAGLNNGNVVTVLRQGPGVWRFVRVIEGPTRAVDGLEGWVNSNYLSCNE